MILDYLKKDHPQSALIAFKMEIHDKRFAVTMDKLLAIADKTKYPLLMVELQGFLQLN